MYLNPVYSVIYLELVIASLWRKNSTNYPGFSWLCKITGRHLNYRPVFCPRYSKQIHKFFQNYLKLFIFELIMLIPGKFRPSWKKWCEIQSDGCLCRLPCLLNIIFWIHGSFSPAEKNSMEVKFFFGRVKISLGTVVFRSSQYWKYWQVFRPIYSKKIINYFKLSQNYLNLRKLY
jgi:hypothetical protein